MIAEFKRLLVGNPIETAAQHEQRLSNRIALAVFSSDALSSVAYASEAILFVLVLAGVQALPMVIPISMAIVVLLLIVGFSYRQTIHAYPNGGGAYIVAHENLGEVPGLVAAASLLIDYVLTVAVSISAGVFAITSLAATWGYSGLGDYRVEIALGCIALIRVMNLRGVKESALLFSAPTYVFIASIVIMVGLGFYHAAVGGWAPATPKLAETAAAAEPLSIFLILRAFAAGCTALTGV